MRTFSSVFKQAIKISHRWYFHPHRQVHNLPSSSRVLISGSRDIYQNLALEDWLYENADLQNESFLLLWRDEPCVVIGRHQNPWVECHVPYCEKFNVSIARRKSGGLYTGFMLNFCLDENVIAAWWSNIHVHWQHMYFRENKVDWCIVCSLPIGHVLNKVFLKKQQQQTVGLGLHNLLIKNCCFSFFHPAVKCFLSFYFIWWSKRSTITTEWWNPG